MIGTLLARLDAADYSCWWQGRYMGETHGVFWDTVEAERLAAFPWLNLCCASWPPLCAANWRVYLRPELKTVDPVDDPWGWMDELCSVVPRYSGQKDLLELWPSGHDPTEVTADVLNTLLAVEGAWAHYPVRIRIFRARVQADNNSQVAHLSFCLR